MGQLLIIKNADFSNVAVVNIYSVKIIWEIGNYNNRGEKQDKITNLCRTQIMDIPEESTYITISLTKSSNWTIGIVLWNSEQAYRYISIDESSNINYRNDNPFTISFDALDNANKYAFFIGYNGETDSGTLTLDTIDDFINTYNVQVEGVNVIL